jgi:putative ABC transport system permease protein
MLVFDVLRLSTRMFRTNRSRTILTILGISVGIAAILFLVSLGYGLQQLILNKITTSDALLSLDITTGDLDVLKLDEKSLTDIKNIPGVDKISPLMSLQAQADVSDISSELTVNFSDSEFFKLDGTVLKSGRFYESTEADKNKIIISSTALKLFNIPDDKIYDSKIKFTLFIPDSTNGATSKTRNSVNLDQEFQIVGVIEDESASYVYMPFSNSNILTDKNYSKVKVRVDKKENLDLVRNSIMEKGFSVSALSDIIDQANQIFRILQIVLASFGIVALVVSAIGMFNTMTIALLERTQEIGIMKALGATSLDIWSMFLSESVIIGFLGGACGIGIGMAGGKVFNYGVNLLAGAMGGNGIDLFFTPIWFILLIITFSTFVGLITGFYPAKRAANINCLTALRYK